MDPVEICKYAVLTLEMANAGVAAYVVALTSTSIISGKRSEQISSQEGLDTVVREEAAHLGLDTPVSTHYILTDEGFAGKDPEGRYRVFVGGKKANRSVVRHELYHIYRDHHEHPWQNANEFVSSLDYWFRAEPQAVAYQAFGIRL